MNWVAYVKLSSSSLEEGSGGEVAGPVVASPIVVGEEIAGDTFRRHAFGSIPLIQFAKVVRISSETNFEIFNILIHIFEERDEIVVMLRPFRFGVESKVIAEHH